MSAADSLETIMNGLKHSAGVVRNDLSIKEQSLAGEAAAPPIPRQQGKVSIFGIAGINNLLLDYYGIALLILLWELAPRLGWIDAQFFPPLSLILQEITKVSANGELIKHIAASTQRTVQGLLAAIILAVPAGFVLGGWFPRLTNFLNPLLKLLGQINAFSLFPLFVLFFGIGELAKFCIIFWSCLWPILFTTITGVSGVDPLLIKLARSIGAGRLILFTRVLLPGALPSIFTGIRIGASVAFLMLIAAEMIGANYGLGYLIHYSNVNYLMPRLYLGVLTIAFLGMALNYFVHWLEGRIVTWKQELHVT